MTQRALFDIVNPEPAPEGMRSPSGITWTPDCPLPVAHSSTSRAAHNSATGAQAASVTRGQLTLRYLRLLRELGPVSDHEASRMLGVGLSSINSTRSQLGPRVVAARDDRDEVHQWPGGRVTHRTRWQLAASSIEVAS